MMEDLFGNKKEGIPVSRRPLAYRMSPVDLKDFMGQGHLLGKNKVLRRIIETDSISNMIFFGPSGSGKTALVKILAKMTDLKVEKINAVTAGITDIRKVLDKAKMINEMHGKNLLVMIDEFHHFNRTQQDALLPAMEEGSIILIGLTTENPYFYVNNAIISRSIVLEFKKLDSKDIILILKRALKDKYLRLGSKEIDYDDDALTYISSLVNGDARYALNILEKVVNTHDLKITIESIKETFDKQMKVNTKYDRDSDYHYDVISAFIKSMRGSDPDATLYWLAIMLNGGEDPRFIARRIAIAAAEDVGLAAPYVLSVTQAAWDLVERIGMPEARIILAEAAVLVAVSPKSNSAYLGIDKALGDIKKGNIKEVPNHLKDANADGKALGHGKGYEYPHNNDNHFLKQDYFDNGYKKKYYSPTNQGREKIYRETLAKLWDILDEHS